ncbi:MAG: NPCBM/NEW2 domain-containing protein [Candidatus Hydrogenedentes bacterium]|nr:NPCBM/NEW2 domain-containing protein [Candidatus Hydrogenedentota bacterium]
MRVLALAVGVLILGGCSRAWAADEPLEAAIALVQQGWGELGINEAAHAEGKQGRPLQIGERRYAKGVGTHAASRIAVDLAGEYAVFRAQVGVQAHPEHDRGSVVFQVFVDGEQRFDSGLMRQADPARPVEIRVDDALDMELVVTDGGDGIVCDLANWADAVLVRAAAPGAAGQARHLDMAPFAKVLTWDPAQQGSHPGRVEELDADQIFLGQPLARDADSCYAAPDWGRGEACIGLEWHENRYLTEVGIRFAEAPPLPHSADARVEWWVGESAWQGDWMRLSGEAEADTDADGTAWRFRIARSDFWKAKIGVQKVRWIFPSAGKPVRVRALTASTRSRCATAEVRLSYEGEPPGDTARLAVYNGVLLDSAGEAGGFDCDWPLGAPLSLNVGYCVTRPGFARSDRTVLRVQTPGGAFGIAVDDVVERGCVYVPDFGVFAAKGPGGIALEAYRAGIADRRTILDQVRALPDQSFQQAMEHVHREVQNNGPTMLSLACDNHKFTVFEDGGVRHRFDPEVEPGGDRRRAVASPEYVLRVTPKAGAGSFEKRARHLEGGWLPDQTTTLYSADAGLVCTQRAFVAPYDRAPAAAPGWLNAKPLFVAEYALAHEGAAADEVEWRLAFATGPKEDQPVEAEAVPRGAAIRHEGRLLAVIDATQAAPLAVSVREGEVVLAGNLPAGQSARCLLYVPGWDMAPAEQGTLEGGTALAQDVAAYWRGIMDSATHVEIPEPLLQDVIYASQVHCLMTARNEAGAARVSPWCGADRYGPLESESQAIIHGMGLMGHEAFARRSLDFFIVRYNADGLLTTGYTLMGMGWHLWTLADFYAVHGDEEWFRATAPRLEPACRWIVRQCGKTKRINPDGTKVAEFGLVAPGVAADWARFAYVTRQQGEYAAGLTGVSRAYGAIDYPAYGELAAAAEGYRTDIRRAYEWTQACSPVLELRNGTWIPYCPGILGCFGRVMDMYPNEDGGRSWGKDMSMGAHNLVVLGVLDEADRRSMEWIADYLEDYWCLQGGMWAYPLEEAQEDWFNLGGFSKVQPYYTRLVEMYALMDEVKPFIRSYFNALPSLLNTENLNLWEHFGNRGAWNKPHETGWFLAQTRFMLALERGDELWLAPYVTQHWMRDGMAVRVRNAPTRFGPVSYEIESHIEKRYIEARLEPPQRAEPEALVLRIRHPEGRPMRAVTVNGTAHSDFDAVKECIRLKPGQEPLTVRATF